MVETTNITFQGTMGMSDENTSHLELCDFQNTGVGFLQNKIILSSMAVMALLTALVNVSILLVIRKTPALQTAPNVFVSSMAIVDFLGSLSHLVTSSTMLFVKGEVFRATLVYSLLLYFCMCQLSMLHITAVAIERVLFITKPLFYRQRITQTVVSSVIAIIWISAVCFLTLIAAYISCYGILSRQTSCLFDMLAFHIFIPSYSVSATTAFLAYGKICVIALKRKRLLRSIAPRIQSVVSDSSSSDAGNNMSQFRRLAHVLKSIKYLCLVLGMFFTLTLPAVVLTIISRYRTVDSGVLIIFQRIYLLNFGANFVILTVMNIPFRKALEKLFCPFTSHT